MPNEGSKLEAYADHEQAVAERYKWWGVYLVREKRRLGGIAEAVQAEEAARVTQLRVAPVDEEVAQPAIEGTESPDELLNRVDAELEMTDALAQLDEAHAGAATSKADARRRARLLEQAVAATRTLEELDGRR